MKQLNTMKFDALLDLDRSAWFAKALEEAHMIHQREYNRDNGEIMEKCVYGAAAEQWLIQHREHENDVRPFKDVLDPVGRGVEVKTTSREKYVDNVLQRANESAVQPWRDFEKRLYIFVGCPRTYKYEFHSIHNWSVKDKRFIRSI